MFKRKKEVALEYISKNLSHERRVEREEIFSTLWLELRAEFTEDNNVSLFSWLVGELYKQIKANPANWEFFAEAIRTEIKKKAEAQKSDFPKALGINNNYEL